jgi:hypothetical protein
VAWKEENGEITARGRRRKKREKWNRYQILRKKTEIGKLTFLAGHSENSFRTTLTACGNQAV